MKAENRASNHATAERARRPAPDATSAAPRRGWLGRRARALAMVAVVAASGATLTGCLGGMENVQVVNDPFLGPTRGFIMYLDFAGYTGISAKESKGQTTLQVMVVQKGVTKESAAVGDKTEFLIGDKIVTLENAVEAPPVANANQSTAFTQWQLTFKLDAQQARRFTEGPLNAVKAHVGGLEFQLALPPKKALKFQQNLMVMTSPPAGAPPT
jgi:hypothetical protein